MNRDNQIEQMVNMILKNRQSSNISKEDSIEEANPVYSTIPHKNPEEIIQEMADDRESYINEYRLRKVRDMNDLPVGNFIDTEGNFHLGNPKFSSVMRGIAISYPNGVDEEPISAFTLVAPTSNNGIRFLSPTANALELQDAGPVNTPVLLGDNYSITGLYVPLTDPEAIEDGVAILRDFYNSINKNN